MPDWLKSIFYGILEGITEWLPISSTGHLILLHSFLELQLPGLSPEGAVEFRELFDVVIQLGAIMAVIGLYFSELNPFSRKKNCMERREIRKIWWRLLIASLPAAMIGIGAEALFPILTGKDAEFFLYRPAIVAAMLILYGILFLFQEKFFYRKTIQNREVSSISEKSALMIGCFQSLALIPGTSRSGATIFGGLCAGLSATAAMKFSFFLAIPAMAGGSLVKTGAFLFQILKGNVFFSYDVFLLLIIGFLTAWIISLLSIRFLLNFVQKHTFRPFGIYRIVLGMMILFLRVF